MTFGKRRFVFIGINKLKKLEYLIFKNNKLSIEYKSHIIEYCKTNFIEIKI